jgi:hypothetical protein
MQKIMGVNLHETKIRIFFHIISLSVIIAALSCEIFLKIKIKIIH